MIKVNGRWFHDAVIEVGSVYTVHKSDSMSLNPGDKYMIESSEPATVNLPNFGQTDGCFITMHPATANEIEAHNAVIRERAEAASGDPR